VTLTANNGFVFPAGNPLGYETTGTQATAVQCVQFVQLVTAPINNWVLQVTTGSVAGAAFAVGIYTSDPSTGHPTTVVANTTGLFTSLTATGGKTVAVSSGASLPPGVYWMMYASSDGSTLNVAQYYNAAYSVLYGTIGKAGFCSNTTSGSGASYALPSSCGTFTTSTTQNIPILGFYP
jgi:hypothetical protein